MWNGCSSRLDRERSSQQPIRRLQLDRRLEREALLGWEGRRHALLAGESSRSEQGAARWRRGCGVQCWRYAILAEAEEESDHDGHQSDGCGAGTSGRVRMRAPSGWPPSGCALDRNSIEG